MLWLSELLLDLSTPPASRRDCSRFPPLVLIYCAYSPSCTLALAYGLDGSSAVHYVHVVASVSYHHPCHLVEPKPTSDMDLELSLDAAASSLAEQNVYSRSVVSTHTYESAAAEK